MEFRNLNRQYQAMKPQMDQAIQAVLAQSHYISGGQVGRLEEELAAYVGSRHCVTCANGTDALALLMRAWRVGPGDAVFVPDFTFFATAEVVRDRGAVPIMVDVERDTCNMDPDCLKWCIKAVSDKGALRPKGIIAVDLFGAPADYERIEPIARAQGLFLCEDGAQGFGGKQNERRACSFGDAATTSFFPAKPLGCYGDGGAIFTNDDGLASLLRSYAVHGKGTDKYDNVRVGVNSRLDTLQAAILQVKLQAFVSYELESVNRAAAYYAQGLAGLVRTPPPPRNGLSSWAQYTIQLDSSAQRAKVMEALKQAGIPSMVYYAKGMRAQTAFADILKEQVCACPVCARLCDTVLSLPMDPYITREEQDRVMGVIGGVCQ